ncbi:hypothetical protein G6F56_008263 [Rhizopus delemar]|nr:hypothetical protein G6F56_008263 [Rhizopus delemar]
MIGLMTFVQQQFNKPPCRSYLDQGSCEFGLLCKYSHIRLDPYTGQPVFPKEILYFQSLMTQDKPVVKKKTRYRLPSGWKVKDLPPSLKPPPIKQGYHWDHLSQWG